MARTCVALLLALSLAWCVRASSGRVQDRQDSASRSGSLRSSRRTALLSSSVTTSSSLVVVTSTATATATRGTTTTRCLGVLVAPAFALASSECLHHAFQLFENPHALVRMLLVHGRDGGTTVAVKGSAAATSISSGGSFMLLELQQPLLDSPPALLQSLSAKTLETELQYAGSSLVVATLKGDEPDGSSPSTTKASFVGTPLCEPQLRRAVGDSPAADQWLCVDVAATAEHACTANGTLSTTPDSEIKRAWVSDGFLLGFDTRLERDVLWGVVWMSETRCDTESVGAPTATPVNTVRAIQTLIDRCVAGRQWTPVTIAPNLLRPVVPEHTSTDGASSAQQESRDGSSDADHAAGDEGSSGTSTTTGSTSGGSSLADTISAQQYFLPAWLGGAGDEVALLTPTRDTAVKTNASRAVAYFVTPRHLVLPRRWLGNGHNVSSLQWATTAFGTQSRVTKVSFETDFHDIGDRDTELVVVELADAQSDLVVTPLVASLPVDGVEYVNAEITLLDHDDGSVDAVASSDAGEESRRSSRSSPVFLRGTVKFGDRTKCSGDGMVSADVNGSSDAVDAELLCAQLMDALPLPASVAAHHEPSTVGVFREDRALVGFTVESPADPFAFSVVRVGVHAHRAFLDAATAGEVQWQTDDAFAADADEAAAFPAYAASLYAADDDEDGEIVVCSGLLIAPKFVLTTASCLRQHGHFTSVGFSSRSGGERRYDVAPDMQTAHPLYATLADFAFDVAVLQLNASVDGIAPVALNPGYPDWVNNATVLREQQFAVFMATSSSLAASTDSLTVCANDTPSSVPGSPWRRGFCVVPQPDSDTTATRFFARHERPGQPLITKSKFGAITAAGFSVHTHATARNGESADDAGSQGKQEGESLRSSSQSSVQVFTSFADNANFINGYARGVVWGRQIAAKSTAPTASPGFVVGLRITKDGPNFCSGTLIASAYVLTAAHCVGDALAKFVVVGGGSAEPEVLLVAAESVVVHPSYGSPHQFSFDAAILELALPAGAYGVTLDVSSDYEAKTRATMFGFGVLSSADLDKPSAVHSIEMPVYTRAKCETTLPDIDGSMLCAGGEKGKDACQGDSGGPLVVRGSSDEDLLVGIVSAGYGCGLEGVPGVYARASSLLSFVQSYAVGSRAGASNASRSDGTKSHQATPTNQTTAAANESRSAVDPHDIESYSSNSSSGGANAGTTSVTTGANASSGSTHAPHGNASGFDAAFTSVVVPRDLGPSVRAALTAFLMSDCSSFLLDPASPLHGIVDPTNTLTLFSRGGLGGLVDVLRGREVKPLYSRKDRFQRGASATALWAKAAFSPRCPAAV